MPDPQSPSLTGLQTGAQAIAHALANEAIIAMAGPEAFARGLVYVRDGRVRTVEYDPETRVVHGRVSGAHHAAYATTVQLAGGGTGLRAHRGRCSCPVALDCKHAAAVLIAARGISGIAGQLTRPGWERSVRRLAAGGAPAPPAEELRLGLELDLEEVPGYRGPDGEPRRPSQLTLRARPVRWGDRGRWVRSGIAWDQLDYLAAGYRSEQRDLLLQLWAAAGAAARFGYPRSAWLSLTSVSPGLWSVLGAAGRCGLGLVAPAGFEQVVLAGQPVSLGLDARREPGGGLVLAPRVLAGSEAVGADRLGSIGDPAHGLFWTAQSEAGRQLVLAPLTDPLGGELRHLVNRGEVVRIPAADRERFVAEFWPAVSRAVPVCSSDGSAGLPEPVPPRLVCTLTYRPEHRIRIDWSVRYLEGGQEFGLDEEVEPLAPRDPRAERDLLARLDLPYDRLPALRSAAAAGSSAPAAGPAAHALLARRDAALFVTDVVPRLRIAGVEVRTIGEPVDYRAAACAPLVEISTTERSDSADWFDLHIVLRVDGERVAFEDLFVALTVGEDVLITDSGVCLDLDRPELLVLKDLIAEAKALRDDDPPGLRISRFQASLWEELVAAGVVTGQCDQWARTVRSLLALPEVSEPAAAPRGLRADLRPYQQQGLQWLGRRYDLGLGAVLADDMGLGKTLQALALICRARERAPGEPPFLVVAPTSVVSNWAHEAARFAPDLRVVTLEGTAARRRSGLAEAVGGADLVVTSYTVVRIDADHFAALTWRGVVLDEAQFVKNHRAKTYQSVRRLPAPFKLAITGTPLENSLMDLWSLLSITAPGLFPHPERFREFYQLPIERGGDQAVLARLRRRIRPLVLRRTKEGVAADLPPKQEQVVEVTLAPRHQRVYQTHLQRERQKVLGLVEDLDRNRFTILRSLTLLRQLALDPSLVDQRHAGVPATKIDLLIEQLGELAEEGHRALVFSQFTGFLGKIAERLAQTGLSHSYLDGRTRRRAEVIEAFRAGETSVFLISLKAGGFGLNLTEADYCFVLDPWWNPATEAQAVDRAHRIGQTRPVMVYRLVARDTIEEKVMELKARKERLFDSVTGDDALADPTLTAEEIRALLAG